MGQFLTALLHPDVPFLRYAFLAGIFSSVAFGVVGTYITVRRISYLAGAIAHSVLFGVGLALFLQRRLGIAWFSPMIGILLTAPIAAVTIGLVSLHAHEREDTVIGAIWSLGMAGGILFLANTPGYSDPTIWLFGNILLLSPNELITILILDIAVVGVAICTYPQMSALIFDAEFFRVRNLNSELYWILLLLLSAFTIALLTNVAGIIMVVMLMTIPAAIGSLFARRLWQIMVISALLTAGLSTSGLAVSYLYDLPSGATIIVMAGGLYVLIFVIRRFLRARQRTRLLRKETPITRQ